MASDDSGLPPERQRPAPTIDLKAKEVSSRPAGGDEPASKKPDPAASEAAKDTTAEKPTEPPRAADAPADTRPVHMRPVVWAAAAGATIAVFGLGAWLGTAFMNRDEQFSQIAARLGKIEAVLANAPATDNAIKATDTAMKMTAENIAALNKRLDDIVGSIRDARSRADNAVATAEAAQKTAGAAPPQQAGGDTEALSNRIAALEQSTRSSERELAADDKISRRAVVASALRDSVERGNPFAAELAAAKTFAADATALAPLDGFASTGVPSTAALARELSSLAQSMIKAIGEPARTGSVMEKIQAGAERLVRIRPVGDVPGDDPAAMVARIEAKAARNDIGGALADLSKLPAPVRAPAEAVDQARGRARCRARGQPAIRARSRSARSESRRNEACPTMIRVALFLIAVGLAALGVAWFADRPGEVAIVWNGWRIETSVMVGAVAIVVLVAALILIWSLLRGVIAAPAPREGVLAAPPRRAGLSRHFARADRDRRRRRARRAEIHRRRAAAGAVRAADAAAGRADRAACRRSRGGGKNLPRDGGPRRHQAARPARPVRRGATPRRRQCRANSMPRKPRNRRPSLPWAGQAVLQLRSAAGDWAGALDMLDRNRKTAAADKADYRRKRAVLLTARALVARTFRSRQCESRSRSKP